MKKNIETLKEEVRKILASTMDKLLKKAEVVDSIQRLGLSYHFEPEIDQVLKQLHNDYVENNEITHIEDLHSLALLFNLLRQHGYPVSPDVLNKFKDEKGNFSERLASDVEGMIRLYEASHLSIHGEDILDEAHAFTSNHLQSITVESNPFLVAKLNRVLKQCPYRGVTRLEARKYISIYHLRPSHSEVLLALAKLDFNALQKLHQKEIGNICKWWNSLDEPRNLSYVRDRIVENYFWGLATSYFEPQYSKCRSTMAKGIGFLTIVDDTYDVYRTIDELELFTAVIERWDSSCLDDLPGYMKLIYKELLNIFEEIGDEDKGKEGRSYCVDYIINDFKRIMQAFMTEARWLYRNYIPTTEEYLSISTLTSCFTFLSMSSFTYMGDIVGEDIFKWVQTQPKIMKASSVIGRLMDDIVSSEEFDDEMKKNIETLKEEVRKILVSTMDKLLKKTEVVDSIQSLGLSYHFKPEIDKVLKQLHNDYVETNDITHIEGLHSLALLFKLLRQHGYPVSSDVFNKFKDEKGNFSERIASDVEGMISLYEASHLSTHGEDILDKARAFTSNHLQSITIESNPFLAAKLNHVLKQCPYRGIPRLEARKYISIYHLRPSHSEVLLTLAKLDFNALQKLHQKEIGNICKWWNSLDVPRNLSYVRNRIVEDYSWALSTFYFEPQYSKGRSIMAKEFGFLTIIDDTYDVYGTIDELELFTVAIERWDSSCLDDLPGYMKLIYKELLNMFEEIGDEDKGKEGRAYCVDYIIKDFKRLVQAFMTEARWLYRNYIPTTEEYLSISTVTSCVTFLSMSSFTYMGDIVSEDIFKWVQTQPKIIKASSVIVRVMDDIVSSEFERKRGHIASLVECYMKDHGVSRQEAIDELKKMIESAWKDVNEECLRPTQVPMPFLKMALNLARFMDAMYKDADNYTHSGGAMKEYITLLFVDPVPI
ncbi:(-)-germacrene D synthase-like [Prosopis cineraria]|uniref:(-)-germacrene D synthase-like n=1 Tax=Prosopis cineraria TaxID=364024 RepID=UPI00240EDD82|nr:(-)-germacrene D synthase-like [Prosopis cineraria]